MNEKLSKWMGKTNMVFSTLAGERVTNREVVYTHIAVVAFLIVLGIAGKF
jgi:hypothetical protein